MSADINRSVGNNFIVIVFISGGISRRLYSIKSTIDVCETTPQLDGAGLDHIRVKPSYFVTEYDSDKRDDELMAMWIRKRRRTSNWAGAWATVLLPVEPCSSVRVEFPCKLPPGGNAIQLGQTQTTIVSQTPHPIPAMSSPLSALTHPSVYATALSSTAPLCRVVPTSLAPATTRQSM